MSRVSHERLARAAGIIASGSSVAAAAAEVQVSVATIRRWMKDPRWRAAYEQARRAVVTEAGNEAVLVLRSLLRSGDAAVRSQAARALASVALRAGQGPLTNVPGERVLRAGRVGRAGRPGRVERVEWAEWAEWAEREPEEVGEAVRLLRCLRAAADRSWEEFARACDEQVERLIDTDPDAARRLLREWHRELLRLPWGQVD